MPKATPGSGVSARLQTPGAEGAEEGAVLERKTASEVVTELDSKFEEWHLHAKQDATQAKADNDAGQHQQQQLFHQQQLQLQQQQQMANQQQQQQQLEGPQQ